MLHRKNPTAETALICGLGRFGSVTAMAMVRLGRQVLAIDQDPRIVQEFSSRLTRVVEADTTNTEALVQLGCAEFPVAIVGIGTSIESSVLTCSNLVDLGIKQIWAKAITPAHGTILERIGVHKVIYPESDAGERVANRHGPWRSDPRNRWASKRSLITRHPTVHRAAGNGAPTT